MIANDVVYNITGLTGVNTGDTLTTVSTGLDGVNTFQLGSTAGSMNVFVSGDGVNYQTAAIALIDLGSTAPSTAVTATTAGGNYGFRGQFKGVKVKQTGATGVANGYLLMSRM